MGSEKRSRLFPALLAALCPFALVAATCKSEGEKGKASPSAEKKGAAPTLDVDFEKYGLTYLTDAAKDQVRQVASDEFCHCGCPHTLGGCLQVHPECNHAPRMLNLVGSEAHAGARASDVIRALQKYHGSFKKEKRGAIDLADVACMGPSDATVTVVEFSDFECPFCAAARPMLEGLAEVFKDKLRVCYKHFPLQTHQHSLQAAQAAEFARSQGKFWEFHDLLFENQFAMTLSDLKEHAQKVGLDPAAMEKAVLSETYLSKINASKEEGKRLGIDSTPSLFVNGRAFSLPISPGTVKHAVEDELEYLQAGRWAQD